MGKISLGSADYEISDPPAGMRHAEPGEVDAIHRAAVLATRRPSGGSSPGWHRRVMVCFLAMLKTAGIFVDGASSR